MDAVATTPPDESVKDGKTTMLLIDSIGS